MESGTNRIRINVNRPSVGSQIESLLRETPEFRVQGPDVTQEVDLLIQELGTDVDTELHRVQVLLQQGAVKEAFLLSDSDDPAILRKVIRSGVSELLPLPLDAKEAREALKRFRTRNNGNGSGGGMKRFGTVVNVLGSKGGVGSTTLAVNLAVDLARDRSRSVALVDLNLAFGEVPFFLELQPRYHWGEINNNVDRLDSMYLSNIMTPHSSGVQVLSSPGDLRGQETPSPNMIEHLLTLMRSMYDFVIVDSGKSLDPTALKVIDISGKTFLLTLLNLPCLSNTHRILEALRNLGVRTRHIQVVVNRASKKGDIDRKDAEEAISRPIDWFIPNDYQATMNAINTGQPLLKSAPRSSVTREIEKLAGSLTTEAPARVEKKEKMFSFL
jgi:pilus assembly protein CpaE